MDRVFWLAFLDLLHVPTLWQWPIYIIDNFLNQHPLEILSIAIFLIKYSIEF